VYGPLNQKLMHTAMIVDNSKAEKLMTCVCKLDTSLGKSKN